MHYSNKTWACPFFRWDEKSCVHCEGGSKVILHDRETINGYFDRYCASVEGWKQCSIAGMLLKFYDKEN